MKVQIKDLKPNPFRDIENYPINPEKIRSLTNSIDETGFWDNILGRKSNGYVEIAYGHHRLVVLKRLFKPNDFVDIPIKKLDDETMIRIMANENMNDWGISPAIIDETVRVTMEYLKGKYHINMVFPKRGPRADTFTGLPLPKTGEVTRSRIAWQMSQWLGSNWSESKIDSSLKRLQAYKDIEQPIAEEAIKILPTEKSATKFINAVKEVKGVTPEQQKKAAEKIVEEQDFSKWGIKRAVFEEKVKDVKGEIPKDKEEEERIAEFFHICTERAGKLASNIEQIMKWRDHPIFNMYVYNGYSEARDFSFGIKKILKSLIKYWGENKLISIINGLTQEIYKEEGDEINESTKFIN